MSSAPGSYLLRGLRAAALAAAAFCLLVQSADAPQILAAW